MHSAAGLIALSKNVRRHCVLHVLLSSVYCELHMYEELYEDMIDHVTLRIVQSRARKKCLSVDLFQGDLSCREVTFYAHLLDGQGLGQGVCQINRDKSSLD